MEIGTSAYLDHLLLMYSGTFNIYKPYRIEGKEYPAYGYYFSHNEKYILVRKANMWTTHAYEHILFIETQKCTQESINEAGHIIRDYMEPVLVRRGKDFPEPDHMYSYMNIVIISEEAVEESVGKQIKKFRFEKGYNFNMRGFSRGNILCVSLADKGFYSNYHGKDKKKIFLQVFDHIEAGKPGFEQIMEERGLTPYSQEEDVT